VDRDPPHLQLGLRLEARWAAHESNYCANTSNLGVVRECSYCIVNAQMSRGGRIMRVMALGACCRLVIRADLVFAGSCIDVADTVVVHCAIRVAHRMAMGEGAGILCV